MCVKIFLYESVQLNMFKLLTRNSSVNVLCVFFRMVQRILNEETKCQGKTDGVSSGAQYFPNDNNNNTSCLYRLIHLIDSAAVRVPTSPRVASDLHSH